MRARSIVLLFIIIASVAACKKKPKTDDSTTCISGTGATDSWTREDMNLLYTINFPGWYKGAGYVIYNGDYFTKYSYSQNDTLKVSAMYWNPNVRTNVWGNVLVNPEVSTIDVDYNGFTIPTKFKKRLCSNGTTIGYYFYTLNRTNIDTTTNHAGLGIVYLKENNDFKQSIIIDFIADKESEALDIASTIKPK